MRNEYARGIRKIELELISNKTSFFNKAPVIKTKKFIWQRRQVYADSTATRPLSLYKDYGIDHEWASWIIRSEGYTRL